MTVHNENNRKTAALPPNDRIGTDKITLMMIESFIAYEAQLDRLRKNTLPPPQKNDKRTDRKRHSRCKTKTWSEERRQKARRRALESRPWEKSTGPRTPGGKENSKMNGLKNGSRSAATKDLFTALRAQRRFVRALNAQLDPQIRKFSGYGPERNFMV
ncbi:MAG TPA: hypothetical protein DEA55_07130 [Rhodospirillaceae bacterium]|nr:hypothetical protein [Rhodospirillaceae bacterium]